MQRALNIYHLRCADVMQHFPIGCCVCADGQCGVVVAYDWLWFRVVIKLNSGDEVRVSPRNIMRMQHGST